MSKTAKSKEATPSGNQATAKLELLCSVPLLKLPGTITKAKAAAAKAIAETKAKTHLLAKRVLESINKQTSACLNSEEIQELRELKTALEDQFVCMMETGGNATSGRDDAVFDDFDELVEVALSSVDDARKALAAHKAVQTSQAAHSAQDVNILPDARTSDDGTTISRTSDAEMLEARAPLDEETQCAQAAHAAKAATEAKAMAIAEAQAKAKKIAEAQARAAAEEVAKAIAKEQAAHAAMAAAEVAKAIAEAEDWFWIPEAKEPEAMVPDAITPVAREPRVLLSDAGTYEPKAMLPVAGESEAVLPESQEPKAMPPVAGENEAMLPDSREHKAMSPIAGKTQAMSPVVKPKPLPDGLVLSCKTPPQPVTAPPQSSNLEKVKLSSPTLLIEQEPLEPPDMLVFSNKMPLQPAKHGQPQPQRGRGVGHRRLCLRRRHRQTMVQHWRCQSHRKRMNTCTVNAMWATSSPMSAPLRPCGRPFRHHLHHHRRRDKLIAGMGTTSSPKSRSLMPYGWLFHQHLHRQAGNGSLPPSAPKTPPTYAQVTTRTGRQSRPPLRYGG